MNQNLDIYGPPEDTEKWVKDIIHNRAAEQAKEYRGVEYGECNRLVETERTFS